MILGTIEFVMRAREEFWKTGYVCVIQQCILVSMENTYASVPSGACLPSLSSMSTKKACKAAAPAIFPSSTVLGAGFVQETKAAQEARGTKIGSSADASEAVRSPLSSHTSHIRHLSLSSILCTCPYCIPCEMGTQFFRLQAWRKDALPQTTKDPVRTARDTCCQLSDASRHRHMFLFTTCTAKIVLSRVLDTIQHRARWVFQVRRSHCTDYEHTSRRANLSWQPYTRDS
ncbi:hypothetical protein DFH11DRAFT_194301 [Phellopilus nigrolimitatus]|nr:hypothetical protein DFH11DRAFT_194301 [Phellopilus nigrolimitatus]